MILINSEIETAQLQQPIGNYTSGHIIEKNLINSRLIKYKINDKFVKLLGQPVLIENIIKINNKYYSSILFHFNPNDNPIIQIAFELFFVNVTCPLACNDSHLMTNIKQLKNYHTISDNTIQIIINYFLHI